MNPSEELNRGQMEAGIDNATCKKNDERRNKIVITYIAWGMSCIGKLATDQKSKIISVVSVVKLRIHRFV